MLVPNQLIEVKVIGRTLKHYRGLGYDVNMLDIIYVPPNHLTKGSHSLVDVRCDICGEIKPRTYQDYIEHHTYDIDCCDKCFQAKSRKTCMDKYGVEFASQTEWFQNKVKDTCKIKYGTDAMLKSPEIREKINNTVKDKYGVDFLFQSPEIKCQIKNTLLQKYGVEHPLQNNDILRKAEMTNLNKYGCKVPTQNSEVQAKIRDTLFKNGNVRTSQQQLRLYEMIKSKYPQAELNYPFSDCSLDVYLCINDIKIDIEYLGWYWHQDIWKDTKRGKFLQSMGLKVLYIKSGYLLPTEEELFDAIDYLVNTEHHFKEIILSDWKEGEKCQEQLLVV